MFACCSHLTRTSYARIISASFCDFMGSTSIALLSISTRTMMYLCPRFDYLGNLPVWSLKLVSRVSYVLTNISFIFFPRSAAAPLHTSNGVLVDWTFFHCWFICPLGVSSVSGSICWYSFRSVVAILQNFLHPQTACIHFIACSMDGRLYTLFACRRACRAFLDGFRGCRCPLCCTKGMQYLPLSSRMLINIGSPLHVMSTSCS